MSIVEKLTEGIVNRDLAQEGAALINKWEQTGLLEGLHDDHVRNGMARLLENQAKELLREASTMSGGDVEGFAAVAFPLVRRVFGSLIANDLVSVQPMSLPSGLIFFLDFTVGDTIGGGAAGQNRLGYAKGSSLYGGGVVGAQITGGVNLQSGSDPEVGPYSLNNGYSSPTGSTILRFNASASAAALGIHRAFSGTVGSNNANLAGPGQNAKAVALLNDAVGWDPDLSGSKVVVYEVARARLTGSTATVGNFNFDDLVALTVDTGSATTTNFQQVRRATRFSGTYGGDPDRSGPVWIVFKANSNGTTLKAMTDAVEAGSNAQTEGLSASFPIVDRFLAGGATGAVAASTVWGLENQANIPEIDIKVDSVAITAITKKLKAKWTPELGQDLNAYHNLDAEVELTQILSEQIALEIDREILEDLVRGSTAGVLYWSRAPGRFLNRETGNEIGATTVTPDFTGNVSEWYETLIETINDVSARIHRKTLRGAANFIVCSPEVANILEFTAGFRANVTADSDRGEAGAMKVGSLSKKLDILVDPYFPRNLILVGRRGSSFLESGYVYAPYVPLQTTPTIFGVEDFVPRKGVMTRYAKKMVRPDMYGMVVVRDLI